MKIKIKVFFTIIISKENSIKMVQHWDLYMIFNNKFKINNEAPNRQALPFFLFFIKLIPSSQKILIFKQNKKKKFFFLDIVRLRSVFKSVFIDRLFTTFNLFLWLFKSLFNFCSWGTNPIDKYFVKVKSQRRVVLVDYLKFIQ